jgi:DNA-binding PadR family transcriptional regulator
MEPLSESTLFILISLAGGPRHGYAILKDVSSLSSKRIELSTGTLYGALKRLVDLQWIERLDAALPQPEERERKVYRLTSLGSQILNNELNRLQDVLHIARLYFPQEPV